MVASRLNDAATGENDLPTAVFIEQPCPVENFMKLGDHLGVGRRCFNCIKDAAYFGFQFWSLPATAFRQQQGRVVHELSKMEMQPGCAYIQRQRKLQGRCDMRVTQSTTREDRWISQCCARVAEPSSVPCNYDMKLSASYRHFGMVR